MSHSFQAPLLPPVHLLPSSFFSSVCSPHLILHICNSHFISCLVHVIPCITENRNTTQSISAAELNSLYSLHTLAEKNVYAIFVFL